MTQNFTAESSFNKALLTSLLTFNYSWKSFETSHSKGFFSISLPKLGFFTTLKISLELKSFHKSTVRDFVKEEWTFSVAKVGKALIYSRNMIYVKLTDIMIEYNHYYILRQWFNALVYDSIIQRNLRLWSTFLYK